MTFNFDDGFEKVSSCTVISTLLPQFFDGDDVYLKFRPLTYDLETMIVFCRVFFRSLLFLPESEDTEGLQRVYLCDLLR